MKVGFFGLGNMGGPMAENLLIAGLELWVRNRTASRGPDLVRKGARAAGSPAEVALRADQVLTCLAAASTSPRIKR